MLPNFDNLLIVMRFSGEHAVTLTDKNRLVIPLRLRENLPIQAQDQDFYIWVHKGYVQIMPSEYLAGLEESLAKLTIFNADVRKFSRNLYSQIIKVSPDTQWRLTLPTQVLDALKISTSSKVTKSQLVVIGTGDSMEIWRQEEWDLTRSSLSLESEAISDRIAYLLMKLK